MKQPTRTLEEAREDARVDAILVGTQNRERVAHRLLAVDVHAIPETTIARLHAEARARAADRFHEGGVVEPDERSLDELAVRMLERAILVEACVVAGASRMPLFGSIDDVERLDANDLATLVEAFRVAAQRAGVIPADDEADLEQLVQRVARRRAADHLRARHSDLVTFYGLRSAREASSLQTLYFATCHRGPTA